MEEQLQTKKRVMVLTQPLWNNYGCLLQAYALQKVIERSGFEVCTDRHERHFASFAENAKDDLKRFAARFVLQRKSVKVFPYRFDAETWRKVSANTQKFVDERLSTVDFSMKKENRKRPPAGGIALCSVPTRFGGILMAEWRLISAISWREKG